MRFVLMVFLILGLLAVPVMAQSNETVLANESSNTTVENATVNLTETVAADLNVTETNVTTNVTDVNVSEEEVGALPGDFTYGFQRFFENVDKFFTFDKSEKAKKHAKYGKMRAVEAHIMTKKAQKLIAEGKLTEANQTLAQIEQLTTDQEEEMEDAQEVLEAAVEEGTANSTDVQEVETELRNSIIVLQRVYEKVPESAKDGVARALNNSINNQQRHEEKMQAKQVLKTQKKEQKANVTKTEEGKKVQAGSNETNVTKPGKENKPDKVKGTDSNETEEDEDPEEGNQTGKSQGKGKEK